MSTLSDSHVWTAVALRGPDSRKRTGGDNNEGFQRHKAANGLVRAVGRKEGEGSLHEQGVGFDG